MLGLHAALLARVGLGEACGSFRGASHAGEASDRRQAGAAPHHPLLSTIYLSHQPVEGKTQMISPQRFPDDDDVAVMIIFIRWRKLEGSKVVCFSAIGTFHPHAVT